MIFNQFLNNLLEGNLDDFEHHLKNILLQTVSIHDITEKQPEKFYHGFLLGIISGINNLHYKIESNKESV